MPNRADAIVNICYQITYLKKRLFLTPTQKCFDLPNKLVVFHFMIFHLSNVFIKYAIKLFWTNQYVWCNTCFFPSKKFRYVKFLGNFPSRNYKKPLFLSYRYIKNSIYRCCNLAISISTLIAKLNESYLT